MRRTPSTQTPASSADFDIIQRIDPRLLGDGPSEGQVKAARRSRDPLETDSDNEGESRTPNDNTNTEVDEDLGTSALEWPELNNSISSRDLLRSTLLSVREDDDGTLRDKWKCLLANTDNHKRRRMSDKTSKQRGKRVGEAL